MDFDKIEDTLPGFLDVLPRKLEDITAQADISKVPDVVGQFYDHLYGLVGQTSMTRSQGYYHPSEVASEFYCPFAAVQARLKKPLADNKDPRGRLTVTLGHAIHDFLQKYFGDIYKDTLEIEVPGKCEFLHMKGSCDGLLVLEHPYRMVLEIKSIYSTKGMPATGKAAHVLQAHCYEYMLEAGLGMVIYYDKSSNHVVGFPHVFEYSRFQTVVDRIMHMESCIKENRMPEPAPHAFCSGCSARDICPSWGARQGGTREHNLADRQLVLTSEDV